MHLLSKLKIRHPPHAATYHINFSNNIYRYMKTMLTAQNIQTFQLFLFLLITQSILPLKASISQIAIGFHSQAYKVQNAEV